MIRPNSHGEGGDCRFEANEVAVGFIGENVNQSVRSLTHVSQSMADTQGSL